MEESALEVTKFVLACVERAGGAAAGRERGVFDILLPSALEAAVGRGLVRLAEDPAALATEPGAELATPGSPVVDELIAWASGRGQVAWSRLPAGRLRRKGLREEVERTLTFLNCRVRHDVSDPDVLDTRYAQFNFRVTYLSDEKRELPCFRWRCAHVGRRRPVLREHACGHHEQECEQPHQSIHHPPFSVREDFQ